MKDLSAVGPNISPNSGSEWFQDFMFVSDWAGIDPDSVTGLYLTE